MAVAWLLTALAVAGVIGGVLMGQARTVSSDLAAAGGGLLSGIALFWLLPEVAEISGWAAAVIIAALACGAMLALDRVFMHANGAHMHHTLMLLLIAASLHSFLDGWSVRAFYDVHAFASLAVPLGLALHKIPEGLALGWVTHKSLGAAKAIGASATAEFMTVIGAFLEPRVNHFGMAQLGAHWTALMFGVIAGSFLFLGVHVLWPEWKRARVLVLFFAALIVAAFLRA